MSLVVDIPSVPAKKPSLGPQPGAKHFDIILGFDFHFLKVPWPMTPCPVTPFAAIVFDPMDYIHITLPAMPVYSSDKGFTLAKNVPMGGTVTINGCYRAAATSGLMALPPMIPIGGMLKKVGLKVKPPNPLHFVLPKAIFLINFLAPHDGQISHGSETVFTAQSEQSALMCNVWSCNELGQIVMNNPMGLFANYATKIIAVLPFGKPVMVGGPFIEHKFKIDDLVNALMMAGIMKGAAAILSRIMGALLKRLNSFLDAHPNIRAAVQPIVCRLLGEPVDVASGHMSSIFQGFSLPGPIPFKWEANYYSDSKYDGPLGKNVYHTYDMSLFTDEAQELVVMRDIAGRAVPFPTLRPGQSFFNPMEKFELHRSMEGEYFVSSKDGLFYYFTREVDEEGWRKLRSIANRNGFAIRFFYDSDGHLEKIIDSSHRTLEVLHDVAGRITEIKLPHPDSKWEQFTAVKYSYDEQGRMTAFHDALNYGNKLEWNNRLIVARRFKDGTEFTFSYDKEDRCYAALGPNGLFSYRFEYKDGVTIVENSLGHKSYYYYNKGIVTRIVDSRGGEKIITYDFFNNLTGEQDAIGNVKSYTYDFRGNLTAIILPGQGTIKTEYNGFNLPEKIILTNGGIWQYRYDTECNLIKKINPLGAITAYGYNNGQLSTVTNETGNSTSLSYDKGYNLEQVKLPDQSTIKYKYDILGRCIKITGPDGSNQNKKYDLLNNLIEVSEPDGNIRRLHYNATGNVTEASDKYYNIQFAYNFFGDITRRTQGGTSVHFKYDTEGQLNTVINEHNEQYIFEMDSEGNVITEIGFDDLTRRYERNLAGQVTTLFRPGGKTIKYDYNAAGRNTLIQYTGGAIEEFEYDALGNLIRAKNNETEVELKHNLMGTVISDKQGKHFVTSEYNSFGSRTHIESSLGANVYMQYDPATGWIEKILAQGWQTEMSRNHLGQELKRSLNGSLEITHSYDHIGRLKQQAVLIKGKTSRKRQYTWDVDNRLKSVNDSHSGTKQFAHDTYGNLTEVMYGGGITEYRLPDAVGNLFTSADRKDRKYGKGSKLLKGNNNTYEYDEEGNLIRKQEKSLLEWRYVWNENGSLQKVIRPDNAEVSFGYDALGRRLWKRYKNTITRWIWNGNIPLHEWKEFDGKENIPDDLITWVFEQNGFVPAAKIRGDKSYSIVCDQVGTPYTIYNESGDEVWNCELNSYGKIKMLTGELSTCPFRFQGQYEDMETGLYYNRYRYYMPEEGRYLSQDPIGLQGGMAFYEYVHDPNNWVDFFGLSSVPCLKPEARYLRGGKHGIDWAEGSNLAVREGIPQGQWGSRADLEFAGQVAATLPPRVFDDTHALPPGHTSVVHMPDGTTVPATHIRVRNNGSGTFHGFPIVK